MEKENCIRFPFQAKIYERKMDLVMELLPPSEWRDTQRR